jgi:hypothetical protein
MEMDYIMTIDKNGTLYIDEEKTIREIYNRKENSITIIEEYHETGEIKIRHIFLK